MKIKSLRIILLLSEIIQLLESVSEVKHKNYHNFILSIYKNRY